MLRYIPQTDFIGGRWRNWKGMTWEIASHTKAGAADFSWRFAKAHVDNDVPFSIYPGMDRIFMMIEGDGMDLEFEDGKILQVHQKFIPHKFSCDVPLICKLRGGPSVDLNLFGARVDTSIECEIIDIKSQRQLDMTSQFTVFFALDGGCTISSTRETVELQAGDAALAFEEKALTCVSSHAKLFVGMLHHL